MPYYHPGRRCDATFLCSDPVQKDRTSRAEHRAKPEHRKPGAFGKIIYLAAVFVPVSARAKDGGADIVCPPE